MDGLSRKSEKFVGWQYAEQIYGFTGYQYDEANGLYFAQARYYMPEIGRFTSIDVLNDGNNWYLYCGNDPVNYVDPSGHIAILPYLVKAGAAASVDLLVQVLTNYLFNPSTQFHLSASFQAVDWVQVASSAAESLIPWKKAKILKYVGAGAVSTVTDTISCWVKNKGEITWEQGFGEFAVGFISGVSGEFMGDAIEKYGVLVIQKGLKRLELSNAKIKKLLRKVDGKHKAKGGSQGVKGGSKLDEVFKVADNYKLSDDVFNNHILDRHGPQSLFKNKSHFNSNFDIKDGIDSTLKGDNFLVKPNTNSRDGYIFEQTFKNPIGVDSKGKPLNTLKGVIDESGNVVTAFPKK